MSTTYARDEDCLWEKPAWAKKGGLKLRSTGYADAMKTDGNLAAPITFTPFKNDDHSNQVANPEILAATDVGDKMKAKGDLALPITNIREDKEALKKLAGR
ncbi:MAG: hypothetical protein SGILL_000672 [Bacillariaceae sp.]